MSSSAPESALKPRREVQPLPRMLRLGTTLYAKAGEHCVIDPNSVLCVNPHFVISNLKLRLTRNHTVRTFAKVGVAKMSGKRPQVMVKLASNEPKITVRGVLKERF